MTTLPCWSLSRSKECLRERDETGEDDYVVTVMCPRHLRQSWQRRKMRMTTSSDISNLAYRHQITMLATISRSLVCRSPALVSVAPRAVAASETFGRLLTTKAVCTDFHSIVLVTPRNSGDATLAHGFSSTPFLLLCRYFQKEVDPTMIHKYKHIYDEDWASERPPTKEQLKHAEELASLSKKPKQPKVKKDHAYRL